MAKIDQLLMVTDFIGEKIQFGDAVNDGVVATNNISDSKITFGDGASDVINAFNDVSNNEVSFGNGDSDIIAASNDMINNTITIGDGQNVGVLLDRGTFSKNTIILGNGNADFVAAGNAPSSNNTIQVGNGQGDTITLGGGAGGDHITTGTGAGDLVQVGVHASADTFAFSLGTGVVTGASANYTTVFGAQGSAQGGDQLVLNSNGNGNALGNTLVTEAPSPSDTTFAQFIAGLEKAGLEKGDTYVGSTTLDPSLITGPEGGGPGPATFIVTDTQSGKIGAIELAGVHTVGIANHVLTLLS
jgi:hypothetical protein